MQPQNYRSLPPVFRLETPSSQTSAFTGSNSSVPDAIIKHLQSRTLIEHYEDTKARKMKEEEQLKLEKLRDAEQARWQDSLHYRDLERKRIHKYVLKDHFSQQYEEMIARKKQRQSLEKQRQLREDKKMNNQQSWMKNTFQQKEEIKLKKLEYGKELQRHLEQQDLRKKSEILRQKSLKQKWQRESQEIARKQKQEQQLRHIRRSMFQKRQNQILGIKEPTEQIRSSSMDYSHESIESPKLMKKYEQKLVGSGLQIQYRSQNQKRYQDKRSDYEYANPEQQTYNPITNPIQFKYKNPNVLRMLAGYN